MDEDIKYYLDEHIADVVAIRLREHGIQVITTSSARHLGAKDPQQLAYATSRGCVLVTQDRGFTLIDPSSTPHTGIAYAPQGTSLGQIIKWLILLQEAMTPEAMINRVERYFEFDS